MEIEDTDPTTHHKQIYMCPECGHLERFSHPSAVRDHVANEHPELGAELMGREVPCGRLRESEMDLVEWASRLEERDRRRSRW